MSHDQNRVDAFISALGGRLDQPPLAVLLDVDGTLAPIAPTPGQAIVPPATRVVLEQLVALPQTTVALVSGRSADDANRMVSIDGVWVLGNHGLEVRDPEGRISVDARAAAFEGVIAAAARRLEQEFRSVKGVIVEDKRWTMSLHYRTAKSHSLHAVVQRATDVGRSLGLVATEGKEVLELRPPVRIDKGTASVDLITRLGTLQNGGSVLYAGDDSTDEDAFRALRANDSRSVTVRIGAADARSGGSASEFQLESPEQLRVMLEWLVERRSALKVQL